MTGLCAAQVSTCLVYVFVCEVCEQKQHFVTKITACGALGTAYLPVCAVGTSNSLDSSGYFERLRDDKKKEEILFESNQKGFLLPLSNLPSPLREGALCHLGRKRARVNLNQIPARRSGGAKLLGTSLLRGPGSKQVQEHK